MRSLWALWTSRTDDDDDDVSLSLFPLSSSPLSLELVGRDVAPREGIEADVDVGNARNARTTWGAGSTNFWSKMGENPVEECFVVL